MNSFKKKDKKLKRKHDKKRKRSKTKKRSSSDSSSSDSSSTSSSSDEKYKKRKHKNKDKHKRRKIEKKPDNKTKTIGESSKTTIVVTETTEDADFSIPLDLMNTNHNAPETKEAYEKRQNIVRRVVDEETGRVRLIKGDGEILEEIVSKERHREINKNATKSDGMNYSNKMLGWAKNNSK
ncbi:hypothetical protein PVAND_003514 [Polypedilum vanderplanki]|uniref:ADP-ribosylation factor-like protein 6-interacting protein 4 n=1 Tax=Polypedilum vanderplanki TaxID=319348 RepID=A0A9J6BVB8_POLVA|nr:hypothetical protein PVAND_003514 [Polypedilum vanderplanki]